MTVTCSIVHKLQQIPRYNIITAVIPTTDQNGDDNNANDINENTRVNAYFGIVALWSDILAI